MRGKRTIGQYRTMDLAMFAVMLAVFESLVVIAARRWFPNEPYTVSVTPAITAIVLMRWGPWAGLHAALGGAVFCMVSGANAGQYAIYVLGNLLSLGALGLVKAYSPEGIRESVLKSLLFGGCVVLLMQVVFFHRKAKPAVLFGILIAFAGVFVCTYFAPGFSLSGRAAGFVALGLTILTGALYALTSPRAGAGYNSITVTAMMAFVGCLVFHIENITMGNEAATFTTLAAHPEALALTVYLGLGCSALCYFIFNRLMVVMDTAVANNIIANSVTAVGVISGVLLLGDPGGWYTAVGLVLTIAGVLLSSKDS